MWGDVAFKLSVGVVEAGYGLVLLRASGDVAFKSTLGILEAGYGLLLLRASGDVAFKLPVGTRMVGTVCLLLGACSVLGVVVLEDPVGDMEDVRGTAVTSWVRVS